MKLNNLLKEFDKIYKNYKDGNFHTDIEEEKYKHYKYVYYSNYLEGNELDLSQTITLLEGNIISGNSLPYFDILETKSHYKSLKFIVDSAKNKYPLSEKIIKETNRLMLLYQWNDPDNFYSGWKDVGQILGECKVKENKIKYEYNGEKGEIIPGSDKHNAKQNLEETVNFINNCDCHIVEKAAELSYRLFIHQFFPDGNKRTARLLANFVMMREKLPLTAFNKIEQHNFNEKLLETYFKNDISVLTEFIARNLITEMLQNIEKQKNKPEGSQERLTKEEFKKILIPSTFWDADFEKLDVDKDSIFIISRLAERGTTKEFFAMFNYYPKYVILDVVNNYRGISKKTRSFVNLILLD